MELKPELNETETKLLLEDLAEIEEMNWEPDETDPCPYCKNPIETQCETKGGIEYVVAERCPECEWMHKFRR
jgi:hypothetical protein